MEQFKTKKENVLLLLQYLEEIRNTNGGGYAGPFRSLCRTFEIDTTDYSQLLRVLKKDNIVMALGTNTKPIYKFAKVSPPTIAQAGKILDDVYKTRRGYRMDRKAKRKMKNETPKDVVTRKSKKIKTVVYNCRVLKSYIFNALWRIYINDDHIYNGSLNTLLLNCGATSKREREWLTKIVKSREDFETLSDAAIERVNQIAQSHFELVGILISKQLLSVKEIRKIYRPLFPDK